MIVKRIVPLSFARITGTLYAVLGLFFGLMFTVIAAVGGFGAVQPGYRWLGPFFGLAAVILLPLFYGGLGFVASWLGALLYNGFAKLVGGIELDVE